MSASLLAALPPDEYRAVGSRLIALLNSKELAFRLLDESADVNAPEHVKRKQVVGGYQLLQYAPKLYERLGELGEPARKLIMGLGELGRWPAPLVMARQALDARRSDN